MTPVHSLLHTVLSVQPRRAPRLWPTNPHPRRGYPGSQLGPAVDADGMLYQLFTSSKRSAGLAFCILLNSRWICNRPIPTSQSGSSRPAYWSAAPSGRQSPADVAYGANSQYPGYSRPSTATGFGQGTPYTGLGNTCHIIIIIILFLRFLKKKTMYVFTRRSQIKH
jgi:hypothetical protein